ncbi:hypothetical protein [Streptomyces sp. NPDC056296]|uniref:hypothetical protein n=1 Tax=Streptomyces sp. NPDC056296 TaxID=3345775 RepID=UPI0035D7AD9C
MAFNVCCPVVTKPSSTVDDAPATTTPKGTRQTRPETAFPHFTLVFDPVGTDRPRPGHYTAALRTLASNTEGAPGTDLDAAAHGFVSITPLDVDRDLDRSAVKWTQRLARLADQG